MPSVAFAHAHLSRATPAENAVVAAPERIVLEFTQNVEPRFSAAEVVDADGKRVEGGVVPVDAAAVRLVIGLPKLPPGTYRVIWHATSVDTHRTEGSYSFRVAP